jgi:hypothetical protein
MYVQLTFEKEIEMFRKKFDNIAAYKILQPGTYDDIVKLLLVHDKIYDPSGYLMNLDKYSDILLDCLERGEVTDAQIRNLQVGPIYFLVRSYLRHHGFRKHGIFTIKALDTLDLNEEIAGPSSTGDFNKYMRTYFSLFSNHLEKLKKADEILFQDVIELLKDTAMLYKNESIFTSSKKGRDEREIELFRRLADRDLKDVNVRSLVKKSGIAFDLEIYQLNDLIIDGIVRGYSLFYPNKYVPYFDYRLSGTIEFQEQMPSRMINEKLFSIYLPDIKPMDLKQLVRIRNAKNSRTSAEKFNEKAKGCLMT